MFDRLSRILTTWPFLASLFLLLGRALAGLEYVEQLRP
jgi:hypothetical protein